VRGKIIVKRQQIIDDLVQVNVKLSEIYRAIVEENVDDEQFDYVNSPILSDTIDVLGRWTGNLEKIVYQK
jgi:hypothetical protein